MKVKNILIVIGFIIVSVALTAIILLGDNKKIYLDDEYYDSTRLVDISNSKYKMLLSNKSSFVLYIYDDINDEFVEILKQFQNENKIAIEKIFYNNIEGTELGEKITKVPAIVIFKNGKLVSFLELNEKNNTKEELSNWFTKYVKLRDVSDVTTTPTTVQNSTKTTSTTNLKDIRIDLPDVKKDDGKVNIYIFWGDGCPHCENAFKFFDRIDNKYKKMFNLYKFEVWKNKENADMMKVFANELDNATVTGVPYIIIGSKSFRGFSSAYEDSIKEAIKMESKSNFDIYFDVIKDKYKR